MIEKDEIDTRQPDCINTSSALYYLNPINWFRAVFSFIFTIALFINHFLLWILLAVVIVLTILFSYDRYALMTFDGTENTAYSEGVFLYHEKYNSPLARGDKDLSSELAGLYKQRRQAETQRAKLKNNTYQAAQEPYSAAPMAKSRIQQMVQRRIRQLNNSAAAKRK